LLTTFDTDFKRKLMVFLLGNEYLFQNHPYTYDEIVVK